MSRTYYFIICVLLIASILSSLEGRRRGRGGRHRGRFWRRQHDGPREDSYYGRRFSRRHMFNWKFPWADIGFNFNWGMQTRSWWEGPNVCTHKTRSNETEETSVSSHHVTEIYICDDTETSYKCKETSTKNGVTTKATVIKECCPGYSRKPGQYGCPTYRPLKGLADTANDLNLTQFLKAVKSVGLDQTLKQGNFTVFAPVNNAFSDISKISPSIGSVVLNDMQSGIVISQPLTSNLVSGVSDLLLGHVSADVLSTSRLNDEQLIDTGSPFSTKIRINFYEQRKDRLMTANCRKVTSRDNMATNGVIHIVEEILQPVTESIVDVVSRNSQLSYLKTAIGQSGLGSELRGDGQFTVFAPTDNAFRKLDPTILQRLLNDQRCLKKVLLNHVLPNVICTSAITGKPKTKNMLSKYLNLNRDDYNKLFVEGFQLTESDIMTTNGVIHIIDEVLVPQEALGVLDALNQRNLSTLPNLINLAGLKKTIQQADNITIFAPTEEAFEKLPNVTFDALRRDTNALADVIKYHVTPNMPRCVVPYDGYEYETLNSGKSLRGNHYMSFPFHPWVDTIQCARFVKTYIPSCNAVIHIIDKVLVPPPGNIVDVLSLDKRFSELVKLVKMAGLADSLQATGPFTVFAPTNDAIRKLPRSKVDNLVKNKDELEKLLKTHVTKGQVCSTGIEMYASDVTSFFMTKRLQSLSGRRLSFSKLYGNIEVENANISEGDVMATNGVIHVIDDVIQLPPIPSFYFRFK